MNRKQRIKQLEEQLVDRNDQLESQEATIEHLSDRVCKAEGMAGVADDLMNLIPSGKSDPRIRLARMVDIESKLQLVHRVLSGESQHVDEGFMKQICNRLGIGSMPTVDKIFERLEALQALAVKQTEIREAFNGIDWQDVDFKFEDDAEEFADLKRAIQ